MKAKNKDRDSATLNEIASLCHELKIPVFLQSLREQLDNPKEAEKDFTHRLLPMLQAEVEARKDKRLKRNYKESGINDELCCLSRITYESSRGLDKALVAELATCDWLRQDGTLNVIVTGMSGTGKTWLVKSLGKEALAQGYKVVYMRGSELVENLRMARQENQAAKFRNKFNNVRLIIIDDFVMAPMDEETQDDLLAWIIERQNHGSMIIASQRPLEKWYEYLGGECHADAILDRLKNSSYIIKLKGRSLREQTSISKKVRKVSRPEGQ